MYKKVLVPLDGSELAECVLPHVEVIAHCCQVVDILGVYEDSPSLAPGRFNISTLNICKGSVDREQLNLWVTTIYCVTGNRGKMAQASVLGFRSTSAA